MTQRHLTILLDWLFVAILIALAIVPVIPKLLATF